MDFTFRARITYNNTRGDTMTPKELNRLVKKLQQGQMNVFDEIYHETKVAVFHTIRNILQDRSLSEDIMQDTYLKALEKIHSFKPTFSFTSWIVTIARNLALNEYNKRRKEMMIDASEHETLFGHKDNTSEKEMIVQEMMEILSQEEREVVILHVVGDLKHREVADILGKPLGTITWMYNNAIKKIQQVYGKE